MWSSRMLYLKSKNVKFKAKEELFNYSLYYSYIVICKSAHLLAVYKGKEFDSSLLCGSGERVY